MPKENFTVIVNVRHKDLLAFLQNRYGYIPEGSVIEEAEDHLEYQEWWQGGDYRGVEFVIRVNQQEYNRLIQEMKETGREIEG